MGEKTAMPPGFWLKPRKSVSPLPLKRHGVRRTHSVTAQFRAHARSLGQVWTRTYRALQVGRNGIYTRWVQGIRAPGPKRVRIEP